MSFLRKLTIPCWLIAASLLLSVPLNAAIPSGYWPIQAAYTAAVEAGDNNALLAAVDRLTVLYQDPADDVQHNQLAFPLLEAAKICEKQGDFPRAAAYYQKALTSLRWLDDHGQDYYDLIVITEALMRHNSRPAQVYALSATPAVSYDALHEPQSGTYFGGCGTFAEDEQSAYLLYVHFYNENIADFSWLLPKTEDSYFLEIAWNMPNESLADLTGVLEKKNQDYIIRNLKTIGALDMPVLIRFAAEVNCWASLPGDPGDEAGRQQFIDAYIEAFRHVAQLADQYAPNAAMAFALNDISNWYIDPIDFYPGDDVVDWVSINSYQNRSAQQNGEISNGIDAYYSWGMYDDQLTKLAPFIEALGDRKPFIIGECGFCYDDGTDVQNEAYAAEKLQEFYTYVNMVYPQIKAVLFFDTDFWTNKFALSGNQLVGDTYHAVIKENAPMCSTLPNGSAANYRPLETFSETADALTLFTYASYPTNEPVTVSYSLSGNPYQAQTTAPYTCTLPRSALTGDDLLTVTISCASTTTELHYRVTIEEETITVTQASATTEAPDSAS